jgi:hypothetical protein
MLVENREDYRSACTFGINYNRTWPFSAAHPGPLQPRPTTSDNASRNIEHKLIKLSSTKCIILVNNTAAHNSTKENCSLRHVGFTSKSSWQQPGFTISIQFTITFDDPSR